MSERLFRTRLKPGIDDETSIVRPKESAGIDLKTASEKELETFIEGRMSALIRLRSSGDDTQRDIEEAIEAARTELESRKEKIN